jgi:hypothetical protein
MKVKYELGIPSYHLNMVETKELEETGFVICTNPATGEDICFTMIDEGIKHYQVWKLDEAYDGLKLSYTPANEED